MKEEIQSSVVKLHANMMLVAAANVWQCWAAAAQC